MMGTHNLVSTVQLNDGYPQCSFSTMQLNDGYPQCSLSTTQLNDGYRQCSLSTMQLNDEYSQCSLSPMHLNDGYPQCSLSTMHLNDGYPQCSPSTMHLNDGYPQCSLSTMHLNDGYPQCSLSTMHLPHNFDLPRSEQQWPARVFSCRFAERTVTSHFTECLCCCIRIVEQTLLLMNAETCTVRRYILFTSKGTLFLYRFSTFSVRKFGCLYASVTHVCWCCLLPAFCTSHSRREWIRWPVHKEPGMLLRHSLSILWFVCSKTCVQFYAVFRNTGKVP